VNKALALLFLLTLPLAAQTPQLSPKAAYDAAMHPLDLTRASFGNWSETELAVLRVTIAHAQAECAAREPKDFTSDDLIDLAHLCALGQVWSSVIDAASLYIAADTPKPRLKDAYASLIDAQLHLKNERAAFKSTQALLVLMPATVPYDAVTAATFDEAITYMQFTDTEDALALATARQPFLLANLKAATVTTSLAPSTPPQTIHELYADGLTLAVLQQLSRQSPAETIANLDAALPTPLAPDDDIPIAALRRGYALLGQPLPTLTPAKWPGARTFLTEGRQLPQVPAIHAITALLLFPDWCAQCIRMGTSFPETVFTVSNHEAYFYGLLAETMPPNKPPTKAIANPVFTPADASLYLNGTPTFAVDASLLTLFNVTDPPFAIITDSQGIIRVAQPVTEDALKLGNTIDSAISLVGKQFPLPTQNAVKPPSPATPSFQKK
jgi:hypothetical protein